MDTLSGLNLINRGKVRDLYDLGDYLLIVTTDRISVFDVILPNPIPDKGKVLTEISEFWFNQLEGIIEHQLITSDIDQMPDAVKAHKAVLNGRTMLVKKAKPLPVECIVRGYLTGSGYKDYKKSGQVCGIDLPAGLQDSDKLPEILFTPSTKAELGEHDENISFEQMCNLIGKEKAEYVRNKSIEIFKKGMEVAESKGIIIADTKFEFGEYDDKIILIDEVLTPDSSRFWPKDKYQPGKTQESLDKQFVRNHYESIGWNKTAPAPEIPADIIEKTREKYLAISKRLRA
ncbi:MAG: phosphoribosylaminoimidazolesuccinocarboxamide synthase [Calditrichaeota bacterium]|nr:phosphoribosylaminoimidazolesuccinocarboxamide synthase [Calditrichota bacterium]